MSDKNGDSLFDSDENGQQILPFDFPEDDESENGADGQIAGEDLGLSKAPDSSDKANVEKSPSQTKEEAKTDSEAVSSSGKKEPEKPPQLDHKRSDVQVSGVVAAPVVLSKPKSSTTPTSSHASSTESKTGVGGGKAIDEVRSKDAETPSHDKKNVNPAPRKLPPAKKKGDLKKNPLNRRSSSGGYPPSHMLREARVRAGLTPDEVSRTTKIKEDFIVALENDDEESFPPKVFVTAYAKQLCKLYKVDPAPIVEGFEREMAARSTGNKVPDEILQDIDSGKQINMMEEERLKRIFKIALFSIAAIVALVLLVKLISKSPASSEGSTRTVAEDSNSVVAKQAQSSERQITSLKPEELEVFIINQPGFTMTKLKVPNNEK